MKHLKSLSNAVLLTNTRVLVTRERAVTTELLWYLREIEARRLYAEQGYASLWDYVTRGLGYCEGSAGRRISAMRLLKEMPNIEPALISGALSLSNASALQHFFQNEEKKKCEPKTYSQAERETDRRHRPPFASNVMSCWLPWRPILLGLKAASRLGHWHLNGSPQTES